ncbi:hypothetical protein DFH11DRAFT_1330233 [Phellopilus nigrolimitatus]|nr:hypothetical protein DFH11DRAFT_1330233 [Phellopilus nigrolimitatus]
MRYDDVYGTHDMPVGLIDMLSLLASRCFEFIDHCFTLNHPGLPSYKVCQVVPHRSSVIRCCKHARPTDYRVLLTSIIWLSLSLSLFYSSLLPSFLLARQMGGHGPAGPVLGLCFLVSFVKRSRWHRLLWYLCPLNKRDDMNACQIWHLDGLCAEKMTSFSFSSSDLRLTTSCDTQALRSEERKTSPICV